MMQKFFYNNRINFLFLFISLFYLVFTIGIDNISFQSTEWLHNGSDVTLPQLSWYFLRMIFGDFLLVAIPIMVMSLAALLFFQIQYQF